MVGSAWSEDEENLLRRLVAEGLSGSKIAARFVGYTRNAVLGKLWRMGLSATGQVCAPRTPPKWPRRPRKQTVNHTDEVSLRRVQEPERSVQCPGEAEDANTPVPAPTSFLDLRLDQCRFVVCDEPRMFCGRKAVSLKPYCEHHLKVTHVCAR